MHGLIFRVSGWLFCLIWTVRCIPPRTPHEFHNCIQNRLLLAEQNWKSANEKLSENAEQLRKEELGKTNKRLHASWHYFQPTFDCPFLTERVGTAGDGGKWTCGFEEIQKLPTCLVYSFGIGYETSFESEILSRTNCTVRLHDPRGNQVNRLVSKFPGRAFVYSMGINGGRTSNKRSDTLKGFMKRNMDDYIDILKIDVEGAEWGALDQMLSDFPSVLPFGQLQLEVHIPRKKGKPTAAGFD